MRTFYRFPHGLALLAAGATAPREPTPERPASFVLPASETFVLHPRNGGEPYRIWVALPRTSASPRFTSYGVGPQILPLRGEGAPPLVGLTKFYLGLVGEAREPRDVAPARARLEAEGRALESALMRELRLAR